MKTYLSVCSGIEAASVAWEPMGWKAVSFSEIEPFPSAVLAHRFPSVPNVGDFTGLVDLVEMGIVEAPDILVGGVPCFTAGHVVLCERGYKPIEAVEVGDQVVSHKGRLCRVLRAGRKVAGVGELSGVGILEPLTCTPDHPLLTIEYRVQNTKRDNRYKRVEHVGKPEWLPASKSIGSQWCALTRFDQVTTALPESEYTDEQLMYIAGLYLGDGWVRRYKGKAKKGIVFGLNNEKVNRIGRHGINLRINSERKAFIFRTGIANWLSSNFGEKSYGKRIPAWVYGHPLRKHLFEGYIDTDGSRKQRVLSFASVSKSLAYGVATLANTLGYASSVALIKTPNTCVIEGRTVNQRDYYQVRCFEGETSRKSRELHGYLCRRIRSFKPCGLDTVYNLEVDGDHSYIVNSAVVHNCQAYSIAGLRRSLDDDRGKLTLSFVRLYHTINQRRKEDGRSPAICLFENVPGILNTKDNAFGHLLAGLVGEEAALQPSGKRWTNAGIVHGPSGRVAWRVLDAQFFWSSPTTQKSLSCRKCWRPRSLRNTF